MTQIVVNLTTIRVKWNRPHKGQYFDPVVLSVYVFKYMCLYFVYAIKGSHWQYVIVSLPISLCRLLQISAKRSRLVYVPSLKKPISENNEWAVIIRPNIILYRTISNDFEEKFVLKMKETLCEKRRFGVFKTLKTQELPGALSISKYCFL